MSDFRVLFVCIGNICRSPLGAALLRRELPSEGFVVTSAGVNALVDHPMDPDAVRELTARGGSADGFSARRLTDDMVKGSDLVLTATREIRSRVLSEAPAALRRTFTVREFAALVGLVQADTLPELVARAAEQRSQAAGEDYDIDDPYRQGGQAHAAAAEQMAAAVKVIAQALQ